VTNGLDGRLRFSAPGNRDRDRIPAEGHSNLRAASLTDELTFACMDRSPTTQMNWESIEAGAGSTNQSFND
jgi:hypothetical protein